MAQTILRLPVVIHRTGVSRSTLYLLISQALFPRPVKLGKRSVGWPASDIEAINTARIAGQNNDQIRALVARLESARKRAPVLPHEALQ